MLVTRVGKSGRLLPAMRAFATLVIGCAVLCNPSAALDRTQLAIVINTRDPLSVGIGEYYAAKRSLSFQNIIKVEFAPGATTMTAQEFEPVRAAVERQARPSVQAYALTWAAPYRVDCMSITSAFAFGFDPIFCAEGCKPTQASPLFNSPARLPFTQLRMRPTMAIEPPALRFCMSSTARWITKNGPRTLVSNK